MGKPRTPPAPKRKQSASDEFLRDVAFAQGKGNSPTPADSPQQLAAPQPFKEDPDSAINATSPILKEMEALQQYGYNPYNVHIDEIEERIGLLSRAIIEYYLRTNYLKPEKKADLALTAIRTLEGTKTEIAWKDNQRKKKPVTIEAYKAERAEKEKRLKELLTRKAERKVEAAQSALELLTNGKGTGSKEPSSA